MNARDEILRRISAAHVAAPAHEVRRSYSHVKVHADRLAQFVQRVEAYKATVVRTTPDEVATVVAKLLVDAGNVVVPAGFNAAWLPEGLDIVRD
ncbi:MAG TPA: lactate utilization protein C, partial [Dermatophilaceae bacterium]